jgi:Flp pilus assembly protein TadG
MRSRRKNQRGQALVESGLVMLVFLPVFIGIMDFGQFLYLNQTLWERTRVAARYGSTTTYTDGSNIVNMAIYNDPAGSANGATPTLSNLQGTDSSADGYVTATLGAVDADGTRRVVVTVTHYPYNFLLMPSKLNYRTVTDSEPYEGP